MSQTPVKKTAFEVSNDLQEDFARELARTMAALSQKQESQEHPSLQMPFSAASGREFSGANMVRLMLTSLEKGYTDNRWMSFRQLEEFQRNNPDINVHIRKGEKGTKILFPQEVFFTYGEDGQRELLSQERVAEIQRLREAGQTEDVPAVQKGILFYPYTVFNAQQIEGFPDKENPVPVMSTEEKQEFVDRFVASSGVHVSYTNFGAAHYSQDTDRVIMPGPDRYGMSDPLAMSVAKLREFFHATGHPNRENRLNLKGATLKPYALEEMRAELFSVMAGQYLGLPADAQNTAAHVRTWNEKFTGGDARAIFQAATDAGKILTTMHQFKEGEAPKAKWFPPDNQWELLRNAQLDSDDKYSAISLLQKSVPILQSKFETYEVSRNVDQTITNAQTSFDELQKRIGEVRQCLVSEHFDGNRPASLLAARFDEFNERFKQYEPDDMRKVVQQEKLLERSIYVLGPQKETYELVEKSALTVVNVRENCNELDSKLSEVRKCLSSDNFKEDSAAINIAADIDDFNARFDKFKSDLNTAASETNNDSIRFTDLDLMRLIKESIAYMEDKHGNDPIPGYGTPYSGTIRLLETYRQQGDLTLLSERLEGLVAEFKQDPEFSDYKGRIEHALEHIQKNDVTRTIFNADESRKVLDTDVINLLRESIEYVPSAVRERQEKHGHSLVNDLEDVISRYKESGDTHLLLGELVNASLLDDDLRAYQDIGLPESFLKAIEDTLQRAEDFGIKTTLLEEKSSLQASPEDTRETFEQAAQDFQGAADNPVLQVRMILQNPDFLEMALKQDPDSVKELAALCDSMSVALSMELDHRQRDDSPAPLETIPSTNHRMRM